MAKILIAEDDSLFRRMFVHTLKDAKHEVIEATNGEEALAKLDKVTPDLVILDIMMPKASGLDVLHEMRQRPALKNTPVIVTTAVEKIEAVNAALDAGAKAYLIKGDTEPEDILVEINKYLPSAPDPAH